MLTLNWGGGGGGGLGFARQFNRSRVKIHVRFVNKANESFFQILSFIVFLMRNWEGLDKKSSKSSYLACCTHVEFSKLGIFLTSTSCLSSTVGCIIAAVLS